MKSLDFCRYCGCSTNFPECCQDCENFGIPENVPEKVIRANIRRWEKRKRSLARKAERWCEDCGQRMVGDVIKKIVHCEQADPDEIKKLNNPTYCELPF